MAKSSKRKSKYNLQEPLFVSFLQFEAWTYPAFYGFQYDYITDGVIEEALQYSKLDKIDCDKGWEDDEVLMKDSSISDEMKHAVRIAALVKLVRGGAELKPVELDTFMVDRCCSCIYDGHHRIRAMQYLGEKGVKVSVSGSVPAIYGLLNS